MVSNRLTQTGRSIVNKLTRLAIPSAALFLAISAAGVASAQSTDGYHSIQVFPAVVDSTVFTQRFTFRNPDPDNALSIAVTYFPGTGTTQATSLTCDPVAVPAGGSVTFASLRALCTNLAAGSQFGYVYLSENSAQNRPFAAYSRAANGTGIGFSVESFPAHTFTSADSVVTGVRRLSAMGGSPAYQTNCFIGNLNDISPPAIPVPTTIEYSVLDNAGVELGRSSIILTAGKLTRLLDIFAAANVPAGNYDDASVKFEELGPGEPGLMTFCTVQDNTSYGADFRIAKQEQGFSTPYSSVGAQDDSVSRDSTVDSDMIVPGDLAARQFNIPATVIAGGNDSAGFGEVYLGDKTDRNDGANARYSIQVESNGQNAGGERPYRLHCQSGSGHSLGDIVRYNTPGVSF